MGEHASPVLELLSVHSPGAAGYGTVSEGTSVSSSVQWGWRECLLLGWLLSCSEARALAVGVCVSGAGEGAGTVGIARLFHPLVWTDSI